MYSPAGQREEHLKRGSSFSMSGSDGNTSFLRAARAGHLDKVLEHLKSNIDINTSNANGLNALHLASKDGHLEVVEELLKRGATVDAATKKGNTALHIASLAGQEEVVSLLVNHGASVNVQSQNGFTPLYMAAQENHDNVVKYLLANGANQSLATEDGFTPLAVAMQQGHDKVVTVLLENDTRGKVRLPALHIAAKKDDVKAAKLLLENDHNPDVTSKSGFTPLHIASHYGNESIANLLIQKRADVNYAAKHNITPLHVAAKWGKTNMVSLLLEKGANIESKTRDGLTPLHCAARSGHEQVVDMLLEREAPISCKTKNGLAPLHMSAQGDHVDAARILLYHRAPVDEVTVDYLTALHVAAHCGHVRVAKLLLDRQADANARALNGFTPLHIACKKNRIKVVELLLKHGASISATTESGLTPLHVASFMGCMNIVIYLLQHDANPDVPTVRGETPLHLAARANQTDIIRILLRNGAQVDARAREQQTPLHIASRLGNVDIVMLLLQHGAKVDTTTKDMYTALHIAAKEGQDEVASVLIENGASLNATTKKGFTPLHLAAKYGNLKVAKLLLQKEAPVDAQGKNGVTPLHVASHYDHQNVALLLLDKGASPHATAKNGHTPLHIAAKKNQMDIANTLLEYGAKPNAESKAGFTPLHLSAQEGHADMSSLLIEHQADTNQQAKNGLTPLHLCAQEDRVPVAEILVKHDAIVDKATKAGYTPLHIASHYGQTNMVKFLLAHGANVKSTTSIGYTPLHQAAQQGHTNIVNVLLENSAEPNTITHNGQTPLQIAQKLGYITVIESLKVVTEPATTPASDEKYKVVAPEAMHETFMSDSEEEGGEDTMLGDNVYRYLTADEMKSLGDDSLPIDVTRDERIDSNKMVTSDSNIMPPQAIEDNISPQHYQNNYVEYIRKYTPDNVDIARHPINIGFLVSFLVDARGGAMRGCRHSGVRVIVPPRSAGSPTRITCRYVRPQRTPHPPPLMEGEALASRVLELGPVGAKFLGPVIIEVPHFAALRGKEREIVILRSDNGETWKEHTVESSEDLLNEVLTESFEAEDISQLEDTASGRITRILTNDFPQYFAVVSRVRQEVHAIGPEGGMVSSTVVPQVQAVFPQGALTKKIKVGLQAQPIDPELTAKLLGHGVAVSPVVTVEPRRRKFHKAITLSMPAPRAHSQGMINQYSGSTPTLRLLCSITGGTTRAQWEDVTGSTPLTFVNDCVSFTTTVSARFWLMDCRNITDATKMATELYREAIHVPFMAKFVVFAKRVDPLEARLRVFCMTDDKEDKTLEHQEHFTEVAKSRDVEVLEGKPQYVEFAGNLVPITKSGEQLQFAFRAFRENRLPFSVRVKDQHAEAIGRSLFMREPKVVKGEPPQQPICILNIVLPDDIVADTISLTDSEHTKRHEFLKENYDYYRPDPRLADMSNLLGEDWVALATQLGLTASEINVIKSEYPDSVAKQGQSMLRMWISQSSNRSQSDVLENALKRIGREDIIPQCLNEEQEIIKKEIEPVKYRVKKDISIEERDTINESEKVEPAQQFERKEDKVMKRGSYDKYSAEEKVVEEPSDEEDFNKTVTERREMIEKRLSVDRSIPASTQRVEIVQEISTIKEQNLVEDKIAVVEQKKPPSPESISIAEVATKTTQPAVSATDTVRTTEKTVTTESTPHSKTTVTTVITETRTTQDVTDIVTHKPETTESTDLLEGVTQRLEMKKVIPRISADEAPMSPKLSKTPPPSPADFIIKEQAVALQEWSTEGSGEQGKIASAPSLTPDAAKSGKAPATVLEEKLDLNSDAVNISEQVVRANAFNDLDNQLEQKASTDEKRQKRGIFVALKSMVSRSLDLSDSETEKSQSKDKKQKKQKGKAKKEAVDVKIKPRLPTPDKEIDPHADIPFVETTASDSLEKIAETAKDFVKEIEQEAEKIINQENGPDATPKSLIPPTKETKYELNTHKDQSGIDQDILKEQHPDSISYIVQKSEPDEGNQTLSKHMDNIPGYFSDDERMEKIKMDTHNLIQSEINFQGWSDDKNNVPSQAKVKSQKVKQKQAKLFGFLSKKSTKDVDDSDDEKSEQTKSEIIEKHDEESSKEKVPEGARKSGFFKLFKKNKKEDDDTMNSSEIIDDQQTLTTMTKEVAECDRENQETKIEEDKDIIHATDSITEDKQTKELTSSRKKSGIFTGIFSKKEKSSIDSPPVSDTVEVQCTNIDDKIQHDLDETKVHTSKFLQQEVGTYQLNGRDESMIEQEESGIIRPEIKTTISDKLESTVTPRSEKKKSKSRPRSMRESSESGDESDGSYKKYKFNIFGKKKDTDVEIIKEAKLSKENINATSTFLESEVLNYEDSKKMPVGKTEMLQEEKKKSGILGVFSRKKENEEALQAKQNEAAPASEELQKAECNEKVNVIVPPPQEPTTQQTIENINATTQFLRTEVDTYEDGVLSVKDSILAERVKIPEIEIERTGISEAILPKKVDSVVDDKDTFEGIIDSVENKIAGKDNGVILKELPEPTHIDTTSVFLQTEVDEYEDIKPAIHTPVSTEIQKKFEKKVKDDTTEKKISGILGVIFSKKKEPAIEVEAKSLKTELNGGEKLSQTITSLDSPDTTEKCLGVTGNDETEAFLQLEVEKYHDVKLIAHPPASDSNKISKSDMVVEKKSKDDGIKEEKPGLLGSIFSKKEKSSKKTKSVEPEIVDNMYKPEDTNVTDDSIKQIEDTSNFLQTEVSLYEDKKLDVITEQKDILDPSLPSGENDVQTPIILRKKDKKSRPRSLRESSESGEESDGTNKKRKFNIFSKKKQPDNVDVITEQYSEVIKADEVLSDSKISSPLLQSETQQPSEEIQITEPKSIDQNEPKLATKKKSKKKYKKSSSESGEDSDTCSKSSGFRLFSRLKKPDVPKVSITKAESSEGGMATSVAVIRDIENTTNFLQTEIENYEDVKPVITTDLDELSQSDDKTDIKKRSKKPKRESSESGDESDGSTKKSRFSIFKKCRKDEVDVEPPIKEAQSKEELLHSEYFEIPLDSEVIVHDTVTAPKSDYSVVESTVEDKTAKKKGIFGIFGKSGKHNEEDLQRNVTVEEENKFSQSVIENEFPQTAKNEQSTVINKEETEKQISSTSDFLLNEVKNYEPVSSVMKQETDAKGSPKKKGIFSIFTKKASKDKYEQRFVDDSDTSSPQDLNKIESSIPCTVDTCTTEELAEPTTDATKKVTFEEMSLIVDPIKSTAEFLSAEQIQDSHQRGTVHPIVVKAEILDSAQQVVMKEIEYKCNLEESGDVEGATEKLSSQDKNFEQIIEPQGLSLVSGTIRVTTSITHLDDQVKQLEEKISQQVNIVGNKNNIGKVLVSTTKEYQTLPTVPDTELKIIDEAIMDQRDIETYLEQECISEITDKIERIPEVYEAKIQTKIIDTPALSSDNIKISADTPEFAPTNIDSTAQEVIDTATEKTISIISDLKSKVDDVNDMLKRKETIEYPGDSVVHEEVCATKQEETETPQKQDEQKGFFTKLSTKFGKKTKTGEDEKVLKSADKKKTKSKGIFGKIGDKFSLSTDTAEAKVKEIDTQIDSALTDVVQGVSTLKDNLQKDISQETSNIEKKTENVIDILGSELDMKRDIVAEHATKLSASIGDITKNGRTDAEEVVVLDRKGQENVRDSVLDTRSLPHQGEEKLDTGIHQGLLDAKSVIGDLATEILSEVGDVKILSTPPNELTVHERKAETEVDMEAKNASLDSTKSSGPGFRFTSILQRSDKVIEKAGAIVQGVQETQKTEDAKNITIESVKIVKDEGVRLIGDISTKDDIKTTASEIEKSSVSAITQGQELISNKVAEAGKVLQLKSEEVQNLGYQEFDKIDHTVTGLKEDMHKMKVEAAGVFGNMSDETKKEVKEVSERASKIKQSVTQEITRKSKHAVEEIEDAASGIKSTAISAKERSLEVAAAAVADAKSTLDSAKDSSTGYKEVAMGKLVELQDAACQEIGGIAQKIGSVKEITCESVKLVESSAVSNLENIKSSSKGMIATARADVELGVESTKQLSKDSKESAEHKLKKLQGDAIDKIGDTIQEIKHMEENVIKSTKDKVAESAIGFIGTDYKDVASGVKSTAISAKERSAEVAAAALTDAKSALVSAKDSTTGYKEVVIGKLEELQDAASQEIGGIAQKIGSVKETTCKTVKLVESSAVSKLENIKDSSKEIIASTRADVDLGVESTKQLSKDCKESVELKLKKLQGDAIDKIGDTIHEIKHMKENVIKSTEDKVAESAIGSIGTDCKDVASAIKSTAISVKERSAEVAAAAVADAKSALDSAKDSNTGYKEVVMGKLEELQDAANQEIGGIAQKIGSVKETTGETVKLVESSAVSNLENIKDCSKEMIASARADAELGVESTKQLSKDCKESAELKLKNLHEGVIDNIGDTSQQIKHMEENIVKSTKDNVDVMKHVAETAIGSVGTDYKNVASGVKSTAISVKEKSAEVAAAAVTNTKSAVDSAKDLTTDYKEVVLEKCVDIQKAATQEIGNIKETTNKTGSETAKFVESSAISSLENIEFSSKEVVATATSHAKLAVDSTKKLTKDCKDSTEFKLMELQGRASDKFGDTVLELKHIEEDVDKSTKDNVEVMANVAKSGVGSAGTDYKEAVVGKLVDLREAATQEIGTIKDAANKIACENVKSVGSSAISNLENVKEGSEKTISDVKLAVDSSRKLTKDCKESAELKLIELQAGTIDKVGGTMQGIKHMEEEVVKSTKDKVEVVENVALDIKSGAMSGLQRAKENSKHIVEAGVGDVRSVIDTSITDCKDAAKDKLTTLHEGTTQEMKNKEKVTVKKMDDTTGAIKTAASEIKSTAIHTLESAFGCSDEAAAAAKFDVLSSVDSTNKSITDRKDAVEEKLKKQKDLSKRKIDEFGESLVNVQKDVLAEKNKIVTQFSAEAESMKEDREKTDEVKCVMGGIVGDQLKKGKGVFKQLPSELGAVKKGKGVFKQLPSELGAVKSAITEKVTDKVTEEASEISTHVTRGLQDVKQKSDDVLEAGESSLKRTGELSEHHIHNIGDEWKEVEAQVVGSKQRASKMFEKLPTTSGFKIDKMISEDIESKKAANKLTGKYAHSQESVKLIPDAVAKTERNMEFEEKFKAEPEEERRMDSIEVTFSEDTVEDKREGTSHSPNRKPLFRLESDDDSFDFDISNRRDSTKSNILENFSEQNLEALVSSLVTDEVIRTVNVDGLEHKLDELEKVIVNVEKTEAQIKSAEEKLEGKLKRVERKFERMASEVMDNETQEAKSSNMTTPEIEEKNENDFRKIVSQLSREEVSDFQTDYASLWDEQTFSHTDEWDSKTPESQADVVELPQGESSSSQSTVGSRPTKVEKDEKDETTDTSEGRQTEIYDQHQLSEEMKELLKDLEKESKK